MTGTVATFYSFKGGVGRTFALANVAAILSQWGFRVLAIDWDIEAPGLDEYFEVYSSLPRFGLIDLIHHLRDNEPLELDAYTGRVDIPNCKGELHWIPVKGAEEKIDYQRTVQELNWDRLFSEHDFGNKIEEVRADWVAKYDFVLIDSRTGITDFSGLTTAQLPDILLVLFTANRQSLVGCRDLALRAMKLRQSLPVERASLLTVPVPARFELREEYEQAVHWRTEILREVTPLLSDWMPTGSNYSRVLDAITIPYVPRWTFGAELACIQEAADSSGVRSVSFQASYVLETIASLIAHRLDRISLLESGRDEFVRSGLELGLSQPRKRRSSEDKVSVFLSYNSVDASVAEQIENFLVQRGVDVWFDKKQLKVGDSFREQLSEGIASADAMVLLLGRNSSRWVEFELEQFLRAQLRGAKPKPLFPIVLKGGERLLARTRMSEYQALFLDQNSGIDEQLEPLLEGLVAASSRSEQPVAGYWSGFKTVDENEDVDWTRLLLRQSIASAIHGRSDNAMAIFRRVLHQESDINWNADVVASAINLAQALFSNGELASAEDVLEHAIVYSRRHPQSQLLQEAYSLLGSIRQLRGDLASSAEAFEISLSLSKAHDATRARTHSNLAHVLMSQGKFNEALSNITLALEIDKGTGDPENIGKSALALGGLLKLAGDTEKAAEAYELAASSYQAEMPTAGLGRALIGLADVLRDLGRIDEARIKASSAFEIFVSLGLHREASDAEKRM